MIRAALVLVATALVVGCTTVTPTPAPTPRASRPPESPSPQLSPSQPQIAFSVDCGPLAGGQASCAAAVAIAISRLRPSLGPVTGVVLIVPPPPPTCSPNARFCPRPIWPDVTAVIATSTWGPYRIGLHRDPTGAWLPVL
jgi:hypothetical protein